MGSVGGGDRAGSQQSPMGAAATRKRTQRSHVRLRRARRLCAIRGRCGGEAGQAGRAGVAGWNTERSSRGAESTDGAKRTSPVSTRADSASSVCAASPGNCTPASRQTCGAGKARWDRGVRRPALVGCVFAGWERPRWKGAGDRGARCVARRAPMLMEAECAGVVPARLLDRLAVISRLVYSFSAPSLHSPCTLSAGARCPTYSGAAGATPGPG